MVEISFYRLFWIYALIVIPVSIIGYYKSFSLKTVFIAVFRTTVQLLFVGFYLRYLFVWNNPWITFLWFLVMVFVSDFAILRTLNYSKYFRIILPIWIALFLSSFLPALFTVKFVIGAKSFFTPRIFIPIAGMIMGNTLKSIVIGMNSFFNNLKSYMDTYYYFLSLGISKNKALYYFFKLALHDGYVPIVAALNTVGLVSLPGMMTGILIGGGDPIPAIKYQILIMITIFVWATVSLFLALKFSIYFIFDDKGKLI